MRKAGWIAAAGVTLFVALAGAGLAAGPTHEARSDGQLTVLAASSLSDVFPKINRSARYSFAGSDQLAAQIQQGAPADVFAAASPKYPDQLYAKGLAGKPVVFCTNKLVLITPRSNPARIHSVYDLRRRGIKLVIAPASVPIGSYTRQILKNLGLTSVLSNVVSEEPDVRSVLAKVGLGEADAGFVYVTDAKTAPGKVKAITLPARAQPKVKYELAIISSSPNKAAAKAFITRVLSKGGQAKLRAAGFGRPPRRG